MSNRRRVEEEDADYFGESVKKNRKNNDSSYEDTQPAVDDDEIDPLDAFMAGLESAPAPVKPNARKAERIEVEDAVDVYMQQRKQKVAAILKDPQLAAILAARNIDLTKDDMTSDLNIDDIKALLVDDGGDDPIHTGKDSDDDLEEDDLDVEKLKKSKLIPLLPPVDHAAMDYPEFNKDFLKLHPEIKALDEARIAELRRVLDVRVSGSEVPSPALSFGHFGFDEVIMKEIRKSGFEKPTPIQCQAIPIALSGRDLIGIAQTGSGKTAAFIWPMLVHIMDQYELQKGTQSSVICLVFVF
jgi:ATP-dependent RNA helicase DDX42